jgi:hypothetical protein
MIKMSEIWKEKAEELEKKAKKQFEETGNFDSNLVKKASKMFEAAERC